MEFRRGALQFYEVWQQDYQRAYRHNSKARKISLLKSHPWTRLHTVG